MDDFMKRHRKMVTYGPESGGAWAGEFQPGDGTKYRFQATVVPMVVSTDGTTEPWIMAGGSLMKSYEYDVQSMIACYERNRRAVRQKARDKEAAAAHNAACGDHYVEYIASHADCHRTTAWALVQWLVERVTGQTWGSL